MTMSNKHKINTVSPDHIPEVVQFIDAEKTLEEFVADNQAVFDTYRALVERYNDTLEAADKACRGQQVKCGPFDLYQFSVKVNADALFNLVGKNKFHELGGETKQVTQYDVDKKKFEVAVSQGLVPQDVVQQVRIVTPSYHSPKKLSAP